MNYGIPYKGSKNKIAEDIVKVLPGAENFYDLFAGGCAITHCAMMSGKYKNFIANDIEQGPVQLFVDSVSGKFKNEKRWIDRKAFKQMKNSEPYVRYCWSFGNGGEEYLYAKEKESLKKWMHHIFFSETPKEARLYWKRFIQEFQNVRKEIAKLTQYVKELCEKYKVEIIYDEYGDINTQAIKKILKSALSQDIRNYMRKALMESGKKQKEIDDLLGTNGMAGHYFGASQWELPTKETYKKMQQILPGLTVQWEELGKGLENLRRLESLQSLQRLESLQSLESLERLQSLESLERLQSLKKIEQHAVDYQKIAIKPNSIIYCDIPYIGTSGYGTEFDYDRFYKWACEQTQPVFISEYYMPEDRFVCIWQKNKRCSFGIGGNKQTVERLFIPRNHFIN